MKIHLKTFSFRNFSGALKRELLRWQISLNPIINIKKKPQTPSYHLHSQVPIEPCNKQQADPVTWKGQEPPGCS